MLDANDVEKILDAIITSVPAGIAQAIVPAHVEISNLATRLQEVEEKTELYSDVLGTRLDELETIHPLSPSIVNELRQAAVRLEDEDARIRSSLGTRANDVEKRLVDLENRVRRIDDRSIETAGVALLDHEVDLGKIEDRLSSLDKGLERVAETTDETVAWRKVATDGFQEMNRRISSLEEWKATGEEVLQTAIEDVASSVGNRIGRLTRSFESLDEDLASAKSSAEDDRLRFSGQIDELERKIEELRREIDSLR